MEKYNDKEMNEYFESLPAFLQENFLQSGAKVENVEQMKAIVAQIIQDNR